MTDQDCIIDRNLAQADIIDRQDLLIMALRTGDVDKIYQAEKNLLSARRYYLTGKRGVRVD